MAGNQSLGSTGSRSPPPPPSLPSKMSHRCDGQFIFLFCSERNSQKPLATIRNLVFHIAFCPKVRHRSPRLKADEVSNPKPPPTHR